MFHCVDNDARNALYSIFDSFFILRRYSPCAHAPLAVGSELVIGYIPGTCCNGVRQRVELISSMREEPIHLVYTARSFFREMRREKDISPAVF